MAKLRFKVLLAVFAFLLTALLVYVASIPVRTFLVYRAVKGNHRGWDERYFQQNDLMGFVPVPHSRRQETFHKGPNVPSRFDGNGLRIPIDQGHPPGRRPVLLALGCSFTFGAACLAKESYPYLLAERLGGSEINAGAYGGGLTHMFLLAQQIIPRARPDVVVVQYSPWLEDRAVSPFAPAQFVKLPQPYFVRGPDGSLTIHPPVFKAFDDFTIGEYREGKGSIREFLRFGRDVALRFILRDDKEMLGYWLRRTTGRIPAPFDDRNLLVHQVYGSIAKLSKEHQAEMLILLMSCSYQEIPEPLRGLGVPIVDGKASLYNRLDTKTSEAFARTYLHWYGDPPELIDSHPNELAHSIYAEVLEGAIRKKMNE